MTTNKKNSIVTDIKETINKRINELIKAGAKKELMLRGLNEKQVKEQLYAAAVCSLLGV